MTPDDMRRLEVLRLCAMVMWGLVERNATLLSNVADFNNLEELKTMAGYAPPDPTYPTMPIESTQRGLSMAVSTERRSCCWRW